MFEAVQYVESERGAEPVETVLGEFEKELEAIEATRTARGILVAKETDDYAWWLVRKKGARLANFIADSKSDKEFVLDLRSGELVEVSS